MVSRKSKSGKGKNGHTTTKKARISTSDATVDEKGKLIKVGSIVGDGYAGETGRVVAIYGNDVVIYRIFGAGMDWAETGCTFGHQAPGALLVLDDPHDGAGPIPSAHKMTTAACEAQELAIRLEVIADEVGFAASNTTGPENKILGAAEQLIHGASSRLWEIAAGTLRNDAADGKLAEVIGTID